MFTDVEDSQIEVELFVGEPWEFGEQYGCGPFYAVILLYGKDTNNQGRESALLRLRQPLFFQKVECEYFIVQARYDEQFMLSLKTGQRIHCNLTRIAKERASSAQPLDLNWWRGGIGLIGTLCSTSQKKA